MAKGTGTTIIRVEKNRNYTVMSNHHIQNKNLSLKAKGLMSLMLSLPDDWDYSINGLAAICKEGPDAIKHTLSELEEVGYITRKRIRNEKGHLLGVEYTIYELPQKITTEKENEADEKQDNTPEVENPLLDENDREKPKVENPLLDRIDEEKPKVDFPQVDNPIVDKPIVENPRQQSTNITNILNKQNTNLSISDIKEQIEYEKLLELDDGKWIHAIDGIVDIMHEAVNSKKPLYINNTLHSCSNLRDQLKKIRREHVIYIIKSLAGSGTPVKNYRAYILASLFNAPFTFVLSANRCEDKATGRTITRRRNAFHNFDQRENVDYEDCKLDISEYLT